MKALRISRCQNEASGSGPKPPIDGLTGATGAICRSFPALVGQLGSTLSTATEY